MEDAETGERRVKEEQARLEVRRREGEARKSAAQQERAQVEAEAARVGAQQDTARQALDPTILEMFDRIARGRNGVAMARAREERCQGCNVRIRPQNFQEIKRNERIITCDSCNRILYYVPDPPAPETPAT
jgi:predicted  nucleic acid-binding Zn-ribbon protein